MTTKVEDTREEAPEFRRHAALILQFLVAAQRSSLHHTLHSIAVAHGTQRSNLSAFIRSQGERRNIKFDRLREVLYSLGVHWDFMLRAQQHRWVHRWGIDDLEEIRPGLELLVESNPVVKARAISTMGRHGTPSVFVLIETRGAALCILRAPKTMLGGVTEVIGVTLTCPKPDERASEAIQSAWMAESEDDRANIIRSLLGDTVVEMKAASAGRTESNRGLVAAVG